ncbi:MAG TPA: thioredoxin-like domain-containing protein [Jatrophihabitantaceae bacterium]|nr:thioredoxin-like domain-containing protein [Jatrophihabitantaceae bacterium]
MAELRGRFVLLDFWTFACGNCLHVLDELRPFEHKYRDILTVIGVHSPKFAHEADPSAVAAAIERYEVGHPVLNDPEMRLWRQYAVRAWPTLVLIDPEGYVVAQAAGEGQVSALDRTVAELAAQHDARGTLRRGDEPHVPPVAEPTTLRFPARAIVLPAQRTGRRTDSLLVADAGHHQLVELDVDGETVIRRIGTGARGRRDGSADEAQFAEPNGLTLLPEGIAPYDVVVADTANHVLRGVRLSDGAVVTTIDLPSELRDARTITGAVPDVLSPWDVVWWPALHKLVVAAAGVHLLLSVDPATGQTAVLAGTTVESLRDGPALDGWLAQPSGLAVQGDRLWFVDAESSSLRWLTSDGELHTAVGEGLFDFGHVDGPPNVARLQHPLGVTVLPDASIAVLDTYNGAVRRWDGGELSTLATGLAEPSGAVLVDGELVVVESAAHRFVRPVPRTELGDSGALVDEGALHTRRPPMNVASGAVSLAVIFQPAPGRKLDDRFGPSTRLTVSASPPELLLDGAGDSTELTRTLRIADDVTAGVLQVTAQAASCDDDAAVENPACYVARQDWGVPIEVRDDGDKSVNLVLLG